MKVVAESLRDNDAYDILKEKGRPPKNKLAGREGVEMGVDVEQFGADHADEQKREPVLARGGPVDVKPERRRKKDTEDFFAALGNAELHRDGWTAPRGESSFIQQLSRDTPFHLGSRLESRYRQGIEEKVKESREVEMERQRCQKENLQENDQTRDEGPYADTRSGQ